MIVVRSYTIVKFVLSLDYVSAKTEEQKSQREKFKLKRKLKLIHKHTIAKQKQYSETIISKSIFCNVYQNTAFLNSKMKSEKIFFLYIFTCKL